jgi:hypothetical protein
LLTSGELNVGKDWDSAESLLHEAELSVLYIHGGIRLREFVLDPLTLFEEVRLILHVTEEDFDPICGIDDMFALLVDTAVGSIHTYGSLLFEHEGTPLCSGSSRLNI